MIKYRNYLSILFIIVSVDFVELLCQERKTCSKILFGGAVRLGGSIDSEEIEVYLSYLEKSMVYILKAMRQMR